MAQQLREATPFGERPHYLICDHDKKYGPVFARVVKTSRIEVIHTPYAAPRANAICERFVGSVQRECLDHVLVLGVRQLVRILKEYECYFNQARPMQGIAQRISEGMQASPQEPKAGKVIAFPVLNGLHHHYRWAA